jgi:hypothetical protein
MGTYYTIDPEDRGAHLFRTREEALDYWSHRWLCSWDRDQEWITAERARPAPIREVTIDAEPIYNEGPTLGWSLWSDCVMREITIVTAKPTVIEDRVKDGWFGYDLRLMSTVNDVRGIPTEGKNLIIVAAVRNRLRFRIFDGDGKVVVDTNETRLRERAPQVDDFRNQLERWWPPHELTSRERFRVISTVRSIVDHTWRSYARVPIQTGITDAAVRVICTARVADSPFPEWLLRLRDATITEGQSTAKAGGYQGPRIDRVVCTLDDGSRTMWWVRSEGYSGGYLYEFYPSQHQAVHAHERDNWIARECLECGAVYDESGHVEPGEMGCDRCNGDDSHAWQKHLVPA